MTNNGKRVAWVTGGGSGIGESGAEYLAADGWIVVVSGRRRQELDRVVANITKKGGKAEAIPLDVSNKATSTRPPTRSSPATAASTFWSTVPASTCRSEAGPIWSWKVGTSSSRSISTASCIACARCCRRCGTEGRLHHQRRVLGPAATSRRCRARPTPPPSMRCWPDPFLQHG